MIVIVIPEQFVSGYKFSPAIDMFTMFTHIQRQYRYEEITKIEMKTPINELGETSVMTHFKNYEPMNLRVNVVSSKLPF